MMGSNNLGRQNAFFNIKEQNNKVSIEGKRYWEKLELVQKTKTIFVLKDYQNKHDVQKTIAG